MLLKYSDTHPLRTSISSTSSFPVLPKSNLHFLPGILQIQHPAARLHPQHVRILFRFLSPLQHQVSAEQMAVPESSIRVLGFAAGYKVEEREPACAGVEFLGEAYGFQVSACTGHRQPLVPVSKHKTRTCPKRALISFFVASNGTFFTIILWL